MLSVKNNKIGQQNNETKNTSMQRVLNQFHIWMQIYK